MEPRRLSAADLLNRSRAIELAVEQAIGHRLTLVEDRARLIASPPPADSLPASVPVLLQRLSDAIDRVDGYLALWGLLQGHLDDENYRRLRMRYDEDVELRQ
jgi:hypothetical protein